MSLFAVTLSAQRGAPPGLHRRPKAAAPIDITGNWVSVVTEDWRWRMLTPKKGDTSSIPISVEGKKIADAWDPATADADGCKAYGAAAIMRVPGRLKISWVDDKTLTIETDAGMQTRFFYFDAGAIEISTTPTWQGMSLAGWEQIPQPGGLGVSIQQALPRVGTLKVVTRRLRAGYLRKNGVPYSENTVLTEYFDRFSAYGTDWLTVLTTVDDPKYLSQQYLTSTHFKREPDASRWSPSKCE